MCIKPAVIAESNRGKEGSLRTTWSSFLFSLLYCLSLSAFCPSALRPPVIRNLHRLRHNLSAGLQRCGRCAASFPVAVHIRTGKIKSPAATKRIRIILSTAAKTAFPFTLRFRLLPRLLLPLLPWNALCFSFPFIDWENVFCTSQKKFVVVVLSSMENLIPSQISLLNVTGFSALN